MSDDTCVVTFENGGNGKKTTRYIHRGEIPHVGDHIRLTDLGSTDGYYEIRHRIFENIGHPETIITMIVAHKGFYPPS